MHGCMDDHLLLCSLPILTDADIIMTTLDSDLFPGISSDIEVHSGFADAQAKCVLGFDLSTSPGDRSLTSTYSTATEVLSAVQTTMSKYLTDKITIVGHSLGMPQRVILEDDAYLILPV